MRSKVKSKKIVFKGYIAQLVEHRAFNLMAAGSNPAIPK
jgi:hypothetical protein